MEVFEAFKKEALARKRGIKQNVISPQEFVNWLYLQANTIDRLFDVGLADIEPED